MPPTLLLCVLLAAVQLLGGAAHAGEKRLGTLAYVVSECHEDTRARFTGRQRLVVQQGRRPPVTVLEIVSDTPVDDSVVGACAFYAEERFGTLGVLVGFFQRLALSPRGDAVVFELSTANSLPFLDPTASPLQEGMYVVRPDGTGMRRLGPASATPPFVLFTDPTPDPSNPLQIAVDAIVDISFSPDGQRVAFTDYGPGPAGEQAIQVFTLDIASGERRQVTRLPKPAAVPAGEVATRTGEFLDDETLAFGTYAFGGDTEAVFTVNADGSGLRPVPDPIAAPGAKIVPSFQVTGARERLVTIDLPVRAENFDERTLDVHEVFLLDGKRLLQLSNFHRVDTQASAFTRGRAFFTGSADLFGENADNGCQLFSTRRRGGALRQLTKFSGSPGDHCTFGIPECYIAPVFHDAARRGLVFMSSCGPVAGNPYGAQLFAMREDGRGFRQLTNFRGLVLEPDGAFSVELPGPVAYASGR